MRKQELNVLEISNISISSLIQYLEKTGWKKQDQVYRNAIIFLNEELYGNSFKLYIPQNNELRDSSQRTLDALSTLSELENRPVKNILIDISTSNFTDILKIKISDSFLINDSIPFGVAVDFLEHIKGFMASAAGAENDPRKYHRKTPLIGTQYAENCRFGHTFHGSFGFSVYSPIKTQNLIDDTIQLDLGDKYLPKPFERRVVERIVRGLSYATEAVKNDDISKLIDHYEDGFNANMAKHLYEIGELIGHSAVGFGVNWSNAYEPDTYDAEHSVASLDVNSYHALEAAYKKMKDVYRTNNVNIVGKVRILQTSYDPNRNDVDDESRKIVIENDNLDEVAATKVHLYLPLELYLQALDAHKSGKRVYVTGDIDKQGRSWYLENIKAFSIIN